MKTLLARQAIVFERLIPSNEFISYLGKSRAREWNWKRRGYVYLLLNSPHSLFVLSISSSLRRKKSPKTYLTSRRRLSLETHNNLSRPGVPISLYPYQSPKTGTPSIFSCWKMGNQDLARWQRLFKYSQGHQLSGNMLSLFTLLPSVLHPALPYLCCAPLKLLLPYFLTNPKEALWSNPMLVR